MDFHGFSWIFVDFPLGIAASERVFMVFNCLFLGKELISSFYARRTS